MKLKGHNMKIEIYEYNKCSTCKKALKFLDDAKIYFEVQPIVDQPPSVAELKKMLAYSKKEDKTIKSLFNTSGIQYRELKIADQLEQGLSEEQALLLMSKNGKLIKRPFLLGGGFGMVGFDSKAWKVLLK